MKSATFHLITVLSIKTMYPINNGNSGCSLGLFMYFYRSLTKQKEQNPWDFGTKVVHAPEETWPVSNGKAVGFPSVKSNSEGHFQCSCSVFFMFAQQTMFCNQNSCLLVVIKYYRQQVRIDTFHFYLFLLVGSYTGNLSILFPQIQG